MGGYEDMDGRAKLVPTGEWVFTHLFLTSWHATKITLSLNHGNIIKVLNLGLLSP